MRSAISDGPHKNPITELQNSATMFSQWLGSVETVVDEMTLDRAHSDRLLAFWDSAERLVATAQSCPKGVRRGPILGLKAVLARLSSDLAEIKDVVAIDELDQDEGFAASAKQFGTLPTLLNRLRASLKDVEDGLVGAAREIEPADYVPDEIVHIPRSTANALGTRGVEALADIERLVLHHEASADKANAPMAVDAWTALTGLASALAVISDNEAVDARGLLLQIIEATRAAQRACDKYGWRIKLDSSGALLPDGAVEALKEVIAWGDAASDALMTAFNERKKDRGRLNWRTISKGRAIVTDKEATKLAASAAPSMVMTKAASGPVEEIVSEMVVAARAVRQDWSGARA